MKKSKVLLVSAIIGAVWSIGFIWLALWFFREIFILPDDPSQALKDVFNNIIHFGSVDSETKSGILIILYSFIGTVLSIKATVSNFTAYFKNERKKCLHAGILYITALNLPSAILCFVEYFDMAKPVKNKSLLISVLFSIPAIICILLLYNISDFITDDDVAITFFFTVTIIVAALFNILAIRTEKKIFVFVAAILYTIGLASVPSAVICYINFARNNGIKQKNMVVSVGLGIFVAALCLGLLAIPDVRFAEDDSSGLGVFIYFIITIFIAALFNVLAIKTKKRALALVAAILYTIGIVSILSAVICYINFARWKKLSLIDGNEGKE